MTIYQPESFYETTLAIAITADASSIQVTKAPNITSGYLVLESRTSNREIIKYTGVTATTLTGCVRGLATFGSDSSAGTGKAHSAGTEIANKDVHYYYAQYYDFLTGVSSTGANTMRIGDGNTISASDRLWKVHTSSLSAFWGLSASGQMVVSEDGLTSYVISAGGSGLTAGDGIEITAGAIGIDSLSSGGLRISANKLAVDFGQGLSGTSAGEAYVDLTHDYSWAGDHNFDGLVTFRSSTVFESSGSMEINADIKFTGKQIDNIPTIVFDADEVIEVSSHPKAVKTTSAGRVYMVSSGAIGTTDPFIGFAITPASAIGAQCYVQTEGIVDGFSGLTPASKYYAAGEGGEIDSSVGTIELQVGKAIAATKIKIEKGNFEYCGSIGLTTNYQAPPSGARIAICDATVGRVGSWNGDLTVTYPSGSGSRNGGVTPSTWYGSGTITITWDASGIKYTLSGESDPAPSGGATAYFYR